MDIHKSSITYIASTDLLTGNVVKLKEDGEVEKTIATDTNAIGVVIGSANAGDSVAIRLLGLSEKTAVVIASGAIDIGDKVVLAAAGKVQSLPTTSGTYNAIGIAMTKAYADDNEIEISHRQAVQITVSS